METLVATVIILTVFVLASMILNNALVAVLSNSQKELKADMSYMYYLYQNDRIELPHAYTKDSYDVSMYKEKIDGIKYVVLEASSSLKDSHYLYYYAD